MALPTGYKELEYIETTGTQYIDTGISVPHANAKTIIEFAPMEVTADNPIAGFAYPSWNWNTNLVFVSNSKILVANTYGPTVARDVFYKFEYSVRYYRINDGDEVSLSMAFYKDGYNNTVSYASGKYGKNKIKSYKLFNSETLVRDLIPCINPSGAVGMYDLANGVFYGNAGTGEFVAGAALGAKAGGQVNIDGVMRWLTEGWVNIDGVARKLIRGVANIDGVIHKIYECAKSLPDGYTRLQHVTFGGSQFIDLGTTVTDSMKAEIDFIPNNNTSAIFGASWSNNGFFFSAWTNGFGWQTCGASLSDIPYSVGNRYTVIADNSGIEVNGVNFALSGSASNTKAANLYLGWVGSRENMGFISKMTLYSFKLYDGDNLIRDLIPCVNPSSEIGLYDAVHNTFYGNSGSGSFTE